WILRERTRNSQAVAQHPRATSPRPDSRSAAAPGLVAARLPGRLRRCRSRPAELIGQHAPAHLLDRAGGQLAQPERAIADADQPVHRQPDLLHRAADLAIAALAEAHRQPGVRALHAVEVDAHRLELLGPDLDAAAQPLQ